MKAPKMDIEVKDINIYGVSGMSLNASNMLEAALNDFEINKSPEALEIKLFISQTYALTAISSALILLLRSKEYERRTLGNMFNPGAASNGFDKGNFNVE